MTDSTNTRSKRKSVISAEMKKPKKTYSVRSLRKHFHNEFGGIDFSNPQTEQATRRFLWMLQRPLQKPLPGKYLPPLI
jgi:hypothetical protein